MDSGDAIAGRHLRLEQLIEGLTDAVVVVDDRGDVVFANAATEQLFGYARAELVGRPVELLLPEQVQELHRAHRAGFVREPRNRPMGSGLELTGRRKDGVEVPVEIGLSAVQTDGGLLVAAVITDITNRRRLEQALVQAQKLEAVGRLAGGIAHEFNNLLTTILGYADFLLRGLPEGGKPHADAGEIRSAAERAVALTRRLLVFSRTQTIEPLVLDLNERVRDVGAMLARLIGEDVEVASRLESGLWPVSIDPGQLEQVVTNLVLNARDAMPGGGQLTIETRNVVLEEGWPDLPRGEFVSLAVSDSGRGMDEDTRLHAVEPFFTTKEPGAGSGLGLATVDAVARQSGGAVRLYSEPGRGTTVRVYLPRAREARVAPPAALEAVSERGTGCVLLVEDEPAVRALVALMVRDLGYDVVVADSGPEALELFDRHAEEVTVLLTDVVMPQLGGRELAERLLERAPGLRVLFMSGYTEDALLRRRELATRAAFLEKPFTSADLGRALAELLAA